MKTGGWKLCILHSRRCVLKWHLPNPAGSDVKYPLVLLLACVLPTGLAGVKDAAFAQSLGTLAVAQPEWLARAKELERHGDWRGLLDWGQRWVGAERENPLAWFVLGRAYYKLNRYPEAIGAYQQNLRIEPGDAYAHNNLGNVYRDSNRYRDALRAYREAVRVNPDYVTAWQNMGRTYYLLKGQAGVLDVVQRIRRVNPDLARAWYSLMVEYYRSRNDGTAREALDMLRKLKPEEVDRLFAILLEQL